MTIAALTASQSATALKVLIVDDYADAAEALALLLTLQGHTANFATSAADAISSFDDFKPDVCFVEIVTPDMDGYQLAHSLRARPAGRHCRLVAMTGFGSTEDIRASLAAGFDDHLVKPVSLEHLDKLFMNVRTPV